MTTAYSHDGATIARTEYRRILTAFGRETARATAALWDVSPAQC